MIRRRIAGGRLHPLHRGVYAVGHVPDTPEARWSAAVLACQPRAALSHLSAAFAHGLVRRDGPWPAVTVPLSRRPQQPKVEIHRADLHAEEVGRHRGIPITTVARTLIDLAGMLRAPALRRAVREAQFLRRFDADAVARALERRRRPTLAALLTDARPGLTPAEDLLLDVCDRNRIRRPESQRPIGSKRVDFVWMPERIVVEVDSRLAHDFAAAYQEDRTVSNELQLMGYEVLRFTWEDLTRRRRYVATTIRRALARGRGPTAW